MALDAVVMAAGEGRRLRPLTERWPKPILPIDGRPVLAKLLRELACAGTGPVWLVAGHLGEQVERLAGDGRAFGVDIRLVRQPKALGSADAVQRAVDAGAEPPLLVTAADTVFAPGDLGQFAAAFAAAEAAGAVAVRRDPAPGPGPRAVVIRDGLVEGFEDTSAGLERSAAPLWGLRDPISRRLCLDQEPHELENAFLAALEAGERVQAVEIGKTRDLTRPEDLIQENFPYLRGYE